MAKTAETTTSKNGFAEVAKAFDMTKAFDIGKAFDMSKAFGEGTEAGAPEDRIAESVELTKLAYEKGIANARELTELATKASTDVFSVITRRFSEGFDELRLYAQKQSTLR